MALDLERESRGFHFSYIDEESNPALSLEDIDNPFLNTFHKHNTHISPLDDVRKYESLRDKLSDVKCSNKRDFLENTLLNSRYLFAKELFLGEDVDTEKRVELYKKLHDDPDFLEFGNSLHNRIGRYSCIDKIVDDSVMYSTNVSPSVFITVREEYENSYLDRIASKYNAKLTLP